MLNSIQQFQEKGLKNLEKTIEKFVVSPTNHADFVHGVTKAVIQLGLDIISETFEGIDDSLRESGLRSRKWHIVKRDETTLLTSLGNVTYKKTLFKNKETKKGAYLTDRIMGISAHARMTEDAEARLLEETVESSYRKGGLKTSLTDYVSKQTVKNKVHALRFETETNEIMEKKRIRVLHINADEDHVSAQFWLRKGDLTKTNGRKINTLMPKLVYLYEDIIPEKEDGTGKRHKLVNPHYFGGLREGKENETLWNEVADYIRAHYDEDYLEKVYICGDGASWIKKGCDYVEKSTFVLDRFHLSKSIHQSISHLQENQQEMKDTIYDCISFEDKRGMKKIFEALKDEVQSDSKKRELEKSQAYLINNWKSITIYNTSGSEIKGCNAESHVSHIYSSRMSSRPMGWSRLGADKISRLRVFYYNQGDMLELVRKQKEPRKDNQVEEFYSCQDILNSERTKHGLVGKYMEAMSRSISYPQVRKIASMKGHIWGL